MKTLRLFTCLVLLAVPAATAFAAAAETRAVADGRHPV